MAILSSRLKEADERDDINLPSTLRWLMRMDSCIDALVARDALQKHCVVSRGGWFHSSTFSVLFWLLLSSAYLRPDALTAQPVPLDAAELQVNTLTTSAQANSAIGLDHDGSFVVVWESEGSTGTDSSGFSIQARRFSRDGTPAGDEFQVNSYTTGRQFLPQIAMDGAGGFVVVWTSDGSPGTDTYGYSVLARRFTAGDAPLEGIDFQVNTYTSGEQSVPRVASDKFGSFVVVWQSTGSFGGDQSNYSIQARRFTASGVPLDLAEVQVNQYTTSHQASPRIAVGADGGFIIVWGSEGSFGNDQWNTSIQARRFAASGTPLDATEFQVNTLTAYYQGNGHAAIAQSGEFVVAWESDLSFENDPLMSVQARRFDANGSPIDPNEFQVNEYTVGGQGVPVVAMNAAGDFVVAWQSVGSFGDDQGTFSVQARRFAWLGLPIDTQEFQLNTYTTSSQLVPRVVSQPEGDFVVAWTSDGSPGSDQDDASVQVRRFGRPTISVTSPSGGTGGPGCTLRDAVEAASSGMAVGGCPPGSGGAVVELQSQMAISLTGPDNGMNGLPVVESSVTVRGNRSTIARDPGLACGAGPAFRLFEVVDGGILSLEDVTLTNGCHSTGSGGAVFAQGGTVILREAIVEGNESGELGGGIAVVDGGFLAFDSTVRGNFAPSEGGGVAIAGTPAWMQVDGSTLEGNSALSGGGLSFRGSLSSTVLNSTISGNLATGSGGGLLVDSLAPLVSLEFTTLASNTAPGAAGLQIDGGEVALHGSLVGDNLVGADCAAAAGTVTASGANLDTDGSCAALAGEAVTTVAALELAPLADQGGPARVHLPLPASPALDAAPVCVTRAGASVIRDQRGYPRPTDDDGDGLPACELGAVERSPVFRDGFETGDARRWSFDAARGRSRSRGSAGREGRQLRDLVAGGAVAAPPAPR